MLQAFMRKQMPAASNEDCPKGGGEAREYIMQQVDKRT